MDTNNDQNKIEEILAKCLIVEYSYIQKYCPLNIYISPSPNNIKQWNGLLIIKDGIYQNYFIYFCINIPMTYPTEAPSVCFQTKIYHPMINQISGELDVKKLFPKWVPGKNIILQLISGIKDIFMNPKYFQATDSFFPESGRIFLTNYIQYENNVIDALNTIDQNKSDINEEHINDFIQNTENIMSDNSICPNERISSLKKYYLDFYMPKIIHK